MTMAEAAGLALAILPLLISAIENYEDCLKPLRRICELDTQANRFQRKLDTQKTIFRNQCRLLLQNIVEQEVAQDMINDKAHSCWTDLDIDDDLQRQLEASKDSCIGVVKDIDSLLKELGQWSSRLESAIQGEEQAHHIGSKAWRSKLRTTLKFSFSEKRLEVTLTELKELNDSFMTLSSQTSKLYTQESKKNRLIKPAKDIAKVQAIQKASCMVYEALGRSCSKHTEHRSHFCLEAKTIGSPEDLQIQFKVAFARVAVRGICEPCDSALLVIESSIRKSSTDGSQRDIVVTNPTPITNKLKRSLSNGIATPEKKPKKSVKFQDSSCSNLCEQIPADGQQNLKDLCMNQNFCDRLKECLQQTPGRLQYMGTLGSADPYRHLVYFPEKNSRRPALSLQEIITISSRQGPSVRLSVYERIHLARSLATAVLQYHATPWLQNAWRCEDIYFFDAEERLFLNRTSVSISEPHIDVPIRKSSSASVRSFRGSAEQLAPNILLFNLGVMLIELAFNAPLRTLLNKTEQSYRNSEYTEFFAARRLGDAVAREMGPKYSKIVRKCLGCLFASATTDFNDTGLQAEYHRDVVKELDGLEEQFTALKINS